MTERLFVRNDYVIEDLDLYIEYIMEPVHCIRLISELASEALALDVYERIAINAFGDTLLTTTKEIMGPFSPPKNTFSVPAVAAENTCEDDRPHAPMDSLPSVLLRFFDQPPSDPLLASNLETSVLLAIREVVTRQHGWTLQDIQKCPWSVTRHKQLQDDISFNLAQQQQRFGASNPSSGDIGGGVSIGLQIPYVKVEETILLFTKRVDVIREVDITEQVLRQQEEKAFKEKQQEERAMQMHRLRMYNGLCQQNTKNDKKLTCIQMWLDAIDRQELKTRFVDASKRSVLHWIIDWSEEAYSDNRLGSDLLRSHILLCLELGLSPLALDSNGETPMTLATSTTSPRPRARAYLAEAAKRSRPASRFPLEGIIFESVAGKFLQSNFSATKPQKFFTLELVPSTNNDPTSGSCLAIFLYDLVLEWKFPVIRFQDFFVPAGNENRLEHSMVRFYVVPFCRESHSTTEGDILLCSNGSFISVDYTTPHPRVTVFKSNRFFFDVFGGEGEGYCCTVQWLQSSSASLVAQENRETVQRKEQERAALRVAKSSYLSSLAKELHELEHPDILKPKTQSELEHDSEDVFSEKFAERILLFPYGPKSSSSNPSSSLGRHGSSGETPDITPQDTLRQAATPSARQSRSSAYFSMQLVSSVMLSRDSPETSISLQDIPGATESDSATSSAIGVVCVLSQGKLVAIPLSRYALTTHATAPLSMRVSKFMEAVDGALSRRESVSQHRGGGDQYDDFVDGLFTPMASRGYTESQVALQNGDDNGSAGASVTESDVIPVKLGRKFSENFASIRKSPLMPTIKKQNDSLNPTPQTFPLQSPSNSVGQSSPNNNLQPKVCAVALSVFTKDVGAPIMITSTPQRILIALPNNEVIQYTFSSNRFIKLLEDIQSGERPLATKGVKTPLQGSDYPCSIVAVDNVEGKQQESSDQTPTSIIWCGKTLAVRTVSNWRADVETGIRDILVEDKHKDQEVTSATFHPRQPHLVVFSRRSHMCLLNLKTGYVSRLCPIILSESEIAMRSQQMDRNAGEVASGIEVLRFNADGSILMRYSPLYRSATLYDVKVLDALIDKEERSLVKNSNLICGFRQDVEEMPTTSLSKSADAARLGLTSSLQAVPKERLRGYLERLTTDKFRSSPQARVDHAFFVVQAIGTCPTFHANVGDGDKRNAAAVIAALDAQDVLKDTAFAYWNKVLDDGVNLFLCSLSGRRAMDDIVKSTLHAEAITAYAARQTEEISRRENALEGTSERWSTFFSKSWSSVVFSSTVCSDGHRTRLYTINAKGMFCVTYLASNASVSEADTDNACTNWPLIPVLDTTCAVLSLQNSASCVSDIVFFPCGIVMLVEHPALYPEGRWDHCPVTTIRPFVPSATNRDRPFLDFCGELLFRDRFTVESIAASWCTNPTSADDKEPMSASDQSATLVGHVALIIRPVSVTQEGSDDAMHSLNNSNEQSVSLPAGEDTQPDDPFAIDIPLLMNKEEAASFQSLFAGESGAINDSNSILASLTTALVRGREHVKQIQVSSTISSDVRCVGPFSLIAVRHNSAADRASLGGDVEETFAKMQRLGAVKVYISDISNVFSWLPTWRLLQLTSIDGQRWNQGISSPSGNPIEVQPLFDSVSQTLWVSISGAECCVAEVDFLSSRDTTNLLGRVHYYFEASHLPAGEAIRTLWATRSQVKQVLFPDLSNNRPKNTAESLQDGVVPLLRDDTEEYVLILLKEGYLCVLDAFVRKSVTVVGSAPLQRNEMAGLVRDSDLPETTMDTTTGNWAKILCGGMNQLVALTPEGELIRFNALQGIAVSIKWDRVMDCAVETAAELDEYGHLGGGIAARTLVTLPSAMYQQAKGSSKMVLPEELLAAYSPPLKYDALSSRDLISRGLAPPRTTRLRGYLATRDVAVDNAYGLAQLLRLLMDAIESGCASSSQRDARGRTSAHVLADLFPHLTPKERVEWFDRVMAVRCNVFACDAEGRSILDRTAIRQFLFQQMGVELGENFSYASHIESIRASSVASAKNDTVTPSMALTTENIIQVTWSRVSPLVLYALTADYRVLRVLCHSGVVDALLTLPQPCGGVIGMKCTSMGPCVSPQPVGDVLPLDHQHADILVFSHGAVVVVYDPEFSATISMQATGGLQWNPSVARTFVQQGESDPSRLRSLTKADPQAISCMEDSLDDSTGFAPLCVSEQHVGAELVWFTRAGEDVPSSSHVVCMAVMCKWYHVLHVVKLFPPVGVTRIFPRHFTMMTATKYEVVVPIVVPRPVWTSAETCLQDCKNINVYETFHTRDDTNDAAGTPIHELEPQRFTQIVHAKHSRFGNVFFVSTDHGFSTEGRIDVHVFSCPKFEPLEVISVHSPFARDLAQDCASYTNSQGTRYKDNVARHHLFQALQRQAHGATLAIHDRTLAWCEGGGGLCVAAWEHGAARHLSKGDHPSQRVVEGCSERISVDACTAGYHSTDQVYVSVLNGSVFTYRVGNGDVSCAGKLVFDDQCTGDLNVSVSCADSSRLADKRFDDRSASFVAVHNLSKRSLAVVPYNSIRPKPLSAAGKFDDKVALAVLHFSPIGLKSDSELALQQEVTIAANLADNPSAESVASAQRPAIEQDSSLDIANDGKFKDVTTLEARNELRAVIHEQHLVDLKRMDDEAAEREAVMLATHASARQRLHELLDHKRQRFAVKECTSWYWSKVSVIPMDSVTKKAKLCSTLEELQTLERVYISMLWPVLRGALSVTDAVDRHGRTLLMHLIVFYASYFAMADVTPKLWLSAKSESRVALRWSMMKQEWNLLLSCGASLFVTDAHSFSIYRDYLPLHSKVQEVLRNLTYERHTNSEDNKRLVTEVLSVKPHSSLDEWRSTQRDESSSSQCAGQFLLGILHARQSDLEIALVKHSPTCCGRGCAFVALGGDADEVLWEHNVPGEDAEVVFLQLPWTEFGALLVTPISVVAVQLPPTLGVPLRLTSKQSSSHLMRPSPSFMSHSNFDGSTSKSFSGSVSLLNKFTIPLRWGLASTLTTHAVPHPSPLRALSHWIEYRGDGVVFQFTGIFVEDDKGKCFLRMWHCPTSFLKAESLSSFAQYMVDQLQGVAVSCAVQTVAEEIVGECARGAIGCIAAGNAALFAYNGTLWTCVLKSADSPRPRMSNVCAPALLDISPVSLGSVAHDVQLVQCSSVSMPTNALIDGNSVVSHLLTRGAPDTIIATLADASLMVFRFDKGHRLAPSCWFPQRLFVPDSTWEMVRCVVVRTNQAAQHISEDAPDMVKHAITQRLPPAAVQLLLIYCRKTLFHTVDDVIPVLCDIDGTRRCGSAIKCNVRYQQAHGAANVALFEALKTASIKQNDEAEHAHVTTDGYQHSKKTFSVMFANGESIPSMHFDVPPAASLDSDDVAYFAMFPDC